MFDKIIKTHKNDIINSVCELIKFRSISVATDNPDMPFGEECKNVLDYTLDLANKLGFRTKNIDGYCCYIEFGEGDEILGILGHLDVVPANADDGWTNPPFEPTISDNRIYGRGAIDDKGPVIASLYAMKAVLDSGVKLNKRVRLILGLNEEKDWKCIEYYKKSDQEIPTIGFSPDADFPCIYAEKGILSIVLSHPFQIHNMEILNIDCKNNALNVVPKYCSITLKYNSPENRVSFENDTNITVENLDPKTVKITSYGTSAHAAHPELGDNAITNLVHYLISYFDPNLIERHFTLLLRMDTFGLFKTTSPIFLSDTPIQDESGILTSNVGSISYNNGHLEIGFNLRVPVNTNLNEIKEKYENLKEYFPDMDVKFIAEQQPLYISKDSKLVQTLTSIFNKKTGLNSEPIAIGGGTYARAFPNCVAFGATFPGQKDMCHQADEFIDIDNLILATKIYAEAIYELGK